jgi:hypothetical protein
MFAEHATSGAISSGIVGEAINFYLSRRYGRPFRLYATPRISQMRGFPADYATMQRPVVDPPMPAAEAGDQRNPAARANQPGGAAVVPAEGTTVAPPVGGEAPAPPILRAGYYGLDTTGWILRAGYYGLDTTGWILRAGYYGLDTTGWIRRAGYGGWGRGLRGVRGNFARARPDRRRGVLSRRRATCNSQRLGVGEGVGMYSRCNGMRM